MCGEEDTIRTDKDVTLLYTMSNAELSIAIGQTFNFMRTATDDVRIILCRHMDSLLKAREARAVTIVANGGEHAQ